MHSAETRRANPTVSRIDVPSQLSHTRLPADLLALAPFRRAEMLHDALRGRAARYLGKQGQHQDAGGDIDWVRRFVIVHHRRHPNSMGSRDLSVLLSALAPRGHVSASTQDQALAALLSLYEEVMHPPPEFVGGVVHAKRPVRLSL